MNSSSKSLFAKKLRLCMLAFVSVAALMVCALMSGCSQESTDSSSAPEQFEVNDKGVESSEETAEESAGPDPDELRAQLTITEDYRDSFVHGEKPAEFQKYIVLHDKEALLALLIIGTATDQVLRRILLLIKTGASCNAFRLTQLRIMLDLETRDIMLNTALRMNLATTK